MSQVLPIATEVVRVVHKVCCTAAIAALLLVLTESVKLLLVINHSQFLFNQSVVNTCTFYFNRLLSLIFYQHCNA